MLEPSDLGISFLFSFKNPLRPDLINLELKKK